MLFQLVKSASWFVTKKLLFIWLFFIKTILFVLRLIFALLNLINGTKVKYLESCFIIFVALIISSLLLAKFLLAKINVLLIYISTILNRSDL